MRQNFLAGRDDEAFEPRLRLRYTPNQLALVPAFGRQRRAMLILVCQAMLILSCQAMLNPIFASHILVRIKPQYLSNILKHFQFQSQKKTMNQIKFLSTSVNTTFVVNVLFCP